MGWKDQLLKSNNFSSMSNFFTYFLSSLAKLKTLTDPFLALSTYYTCSSLANLTLLRVVPKLFQKPMIDRLVTFLNLCIGFSDYHVIFIGFLLVCIKEILHIRTVIKFDK